MKKYDIKFEQYNDTITFVLCIIAIFYFIYYQNTKNYIRQYNLEKIKRLPVKYKWNLPKIYL